MNVKLWVVRAELGKYADDFRNGGYVAVDYGISEPYPIGKPREAFEDAFKKYNSSVTSNVVIGQQAGQITRFCEGLQVGDYVITPSDNNGVLYYGKVLDEPYRYEAEPTDSCPYRHRRSVKWSENTESRSTFSVPFQNTIRSSLTVFSVSKATDFLTKIDADGYEPPAKAPPYNHYKSVLDQILTLDAQEFEVLVKELLHAIGFEDTEVTGKPGDGGVDVIGLLNVFNLARVRVYVQAKRCELGKKITGNDVTQLRRAIRSNEQGAFITTADYQSSAHEAAEAAGHPRIGLINGRQLVNLLVEHWKDIPEGFQSKLGLKIGLVPSN